MGERTIETVGSCTFEDLTNNRKAVILMNTFKPKGWLGKSKSGKKDEVIGMVYESTKLTGDKESIKKNYCRDMTFITDLDELKDVKEKICDVNGSWLKQMDIGEETYWDIDRD